MIAALLLLAPLLQDEVRMASGALETGALVSASLEAVVLKDALDSEHTLKGSEVLEIQLGNLPNALSQGEAFFAALDFQNAAASFGVAAEEEGPFWLGPWASLRTQHTGIIVPAKEFQ